MKKLLSLTLALVLLAGLLPITAIPAAASALPPGVTVLVDTILDYDSIGEFSEGLAPVRVIEGGNLKTGYIDTAGQIVIPLNMDSNWAYPFSEGLAGVARSTGEIAFIDNTGAYVIPYEKNFSGFKPMFTGGIARVNGGLINKNGDYIIGPDADIHAWPIGDGLADVMFDTVAGYERGIVDINGNYLFGPSYDFGFRGYYDGLLMFVDDDGVCTFYNKTGTLVRTLDLGSLGYGVHWLAGGIIIIWDEDDVFGAYDVSTNTVTLFPGYDVVGEYYNGLLYAGRYINGNYEDYLMDRTGKIIFERCNYFWVDYEWAPSGLMYAEKGDSVGIVNNKGEVIVPFGLYREVVAGSGGLIAVQGFNGRWGILHSDGAGVPDIGPGPGVTVTGSVPGTFINLTAESVSLGSVSVAAFSTDGGKKWKAGDLPTGKKFSRLLNKGMTLHVTDNYDRKAKKPAAGAAVVIFSKIDARPKRNAEKLVPFYGDDNWVLAKKGTSAAVFAGYEYAPSSDGRNPDDDTWLPVPQGGIPIIAGKARTSYLFRAAPTAARAASTPWRVRPAGFGKAPNIKVKQAKVPGSSDKVGVITFGKGSQYKVGNAPYTAALTAKTTVPVSQLAAQGGAVYIRRAATGKRPPSEAQEISLS
jgi:hypothetical protein